MAVDFHCMKFATINDNNIYFEVVNKDYESDCYFQDNECETKLIQNCKHQFLVAGEEFVRFEEREIGPTRRGDQEFKIYQVSDCYTSSASIGLPVVLAVHDKEKFMIICSSVDENGLGLCVKEVPNDMMEPIPEAVFILVFEWENYYKIASSLSPNCFLSFDTDGIPKLVLRDTVPERFQLFSPEDLI